MRDNLYVLAGDVGGTNLRVAAVTGEGEIIHQSSAETPQTGAVSDIVDAIVGQVEACVGGVGSQFSARAFGLAIAALVNTREGRILSSPNLPELDGSSLSADISARLGINVLLENDATAAAIGERWRGASKDVDDSIFVTIGTGIGGGLILDGRPYRGADGTAGEIGHILVQPDGVQCGCGRLGCVEQYASATAVVRIARELMVQTGTSVLDEHRSFSSKDVFKAASAGDEVAIETFRIMGNYLGIALADLINVLNPAMIVIGGGGAGGWDFFIEATRSRIRESAFRHPADRAKLVRASLGDSAGILGAARVALDGLPSETHN